MRVAKSWLLSQLPGRRGRHYRRKLFAELQEQFLFYQHDYRGGYAEYRERQIARNRESCAANNPAWADAETLSAIARDLEAHELGRTGICHGARNGFEVSWFRDRTGGDVVGTDISDTANDIPHMHEWDFHEENPDWLGRFEFVYSNALDHAIDPARALKTWTAQLVPNGRVYVEHTMGHAPADANATDPFGAHPMIMPYLFFEWGRGCFEFTDMLRVEAKANNRLKAWVFVLTPARLP